MEIEDVRTLARAPGAWSSGQVTLAPDDLLSSFRSLPARGPYSDGSPPGEWTLTPVGLAWVACLRDQWARGLVTDQFAEYTLVRGRSGSGLGKRFEDCNGVRAALQMCAWDNVHVIGWAGSADDVVRTTSPVVVADLQAGWAATRSGSLYGLGRPRRIW